MTPVAQLVLVHQDAQAGGQRVVEVEVALRQHRAGIAGGQRVVGPGQALVVVGVQVVGRRQERDDPAEALDAQPDDLLLAAHPAVVGGEAARAAR